MRRFEVDQTQVQARIPDIRKRHSLLGRTGPNAVLQRSQVDQQLTLARRQDAFTLVVVVPSPNHILATIPESRASAFQTLILQHPTGD